MWSAFFASSKIDEDIKNLNDFSGMVDHNLEFRNPYVLFFNCCNQNSTKTLFL